jgi:nickel/cobalt transporter (NicO) family protein
MVSVKSIIYPNPQTVRALEFILVPLTLNSYSRPFPGMRMGFLAALLFPFSVFAHPLGDFSINQYFVIDGTGPMLQVRYLLDVAEIPSFTELDLLDTDFDSEIGQAEVDTYLAQRIPQLVKHLNLRAGDTPVELTLVRQKLVLLQGNAGMVVFNILLDFEARELEWPATDPIRLRLSSDNYPQEQGTHECLVLSGTSMIDTTPENESQKPLDLENLEGVYTGLTASFVIELRPGIDESIPARGPFPDYSWTSTARLAREQGELGVAEGIAQAMVEPGLQGEEPGGPGKPLLSIAKDVSPATLGTGTREGPDTYANRLMNQVSAIVRQPELPPLLLGLGLLIAALLGMGHALAPGHGKTVMAAYLIGEKGTVWHAIILGIVVTLTHTWSVIFLGVVTLYFEGFISEEQVNFWTGIVSGLIIVVIGIALFRQRYHDFLATAQGKGNDWRFYHGHDHGPEEVLIEPQAEEGTPSYRNILWLGISGGVVPCPAALIVLLLALKVGRLSYGLGLILAFSTGLAAVLVLIGVLVVRASRLLQRTGIRESGVLLILPLGSAVLITLLGAWVVVWTLLQFQVLKFG